MVTGGAGFIGSHIVRGLLRRGRAVCIVDNFSTGRKENLADILEQFADQVELFDQDICDLHGLKQVLEGAGTVYHQAAVPSVQKSVEDPLRSNENNIDGTLRVFIAARDAKVKKVVYASSSSIYGESEELPKTEEMKPEPISPYGVTKYTAELYGKVFSEIYNLSNVGLRYFNVFGPYQDPQSDYAAVIPRFVSRMLAGERPIIYGDGEQSRDFTFVHNVVTANFLAADAEATGLAMNIACGERFTLNELVGALNEILATRLEPIYEAARPGDIRHSEADISVARNTIGFRPEMGFKEGLRRTVEWFQKQLIKVSDI